MSTSEHTLCVGADFDSPLYTPSCSCGWSGDPVVSERTAWRMASEALGMTGGPAKAAK